MGRGTISLNSLPKHKRFYGDNDFFLRPIFQTNTQYFFFLRPSKSKGYLYDLEGEFGVGEKSAQYEKQEIAKGEYANTKFFYFKEELDDCSEIQRKGILKWAIDGEIKMPD